MNKLYKLLTILLVLVTANNVGAVIDNSAWQPYDTPYYATDRKPHPVVPEPSTYGAVFIGLALSFVGYRRWRNSRLTKD